MSHHLLNILRKVREPCIILKETEVKKSWLKFGLLRNATPRKRTQTLSYHISCVQLSYFLFSACPYLEVECLEELRAGTLGELRGPVARVDMLAQLLKVATFFSSSSNQNQTAKVLSIIDNVDTPLNGLNNFTKAKCRSLKKFTCKGTLRQEFICLRPPLPPMTPYPHLHTVYVYTVYRTYSHRKGGRRES